MTTEYISPVMNGIADVVNICNRLGVVKDLNTIRDTIDVQLTNYNIEARKQGKPSLKLVEETSVNGNVYHKVV